jgi:hypothetical protein
MPSSQWHKLYTSYVAATPAVLFDLLADMPGYVRWLPGSAQFSGTAEVEPYPVRQGSRYHDGKPDQPGRDWWGTVAGFQRPGSLDFCHTIAVTQLRATVEVHIHYSLEPQEASTLVSRWLILDIKMPAITRPLRRLMISSFDEENLRTMAALKKYAESQAATPSD